MLIEVPKGQYVRGITTTPKGVNIDFASPKKVALLFVCLNPHYWPYVAQAIRDCRKYFLPHHQVDYFVWTDYSPEDKKAQVELFIKHVQDWKTADSVKKPEILGSFLGLFTQTIRLYEQFYAQQLQVAVQQLAQQGLFFRNQGQQFWLECARPVFTEQDLNLLLEVAKGILALSHGDIDNAIQGVKVIETGSVAWPSPTLMRYHLFLNEESTLKEYDYIFYMDADMKVVDTVGDEILGTELVAAPHPGYAVMSILIPPYEPNPQSTAYIPRLGKVVEENGKSRFYPFYAAGGFQGGTSASFVAAMKQMKENIDKDFDNNYVAIWNDESHWNKYLFDYQQKGGDITFLDPSYVYPDSLIDELYVPKIWGKKYPPKIITLTKPFTLSSEGAAAIKEMTK